MSLKRANLRISALEKQIGEHPPDLSRVLGPLYVGVDIGTANVVTVVLNQKGRPVACEIDPGKVVREGMVVDYLHAVHLVERQKERIEKSLGVSLIQAASAVPPGTEHDNGRVTANILEAAGYEVCRILDEPTAAALVLDIQNGAVVDVGGGTTGISLLKDGAVVFTADEATGGVHFDLVLAGGLGISAEEAEQIKRDPSQQKRLFPVVRPVMEKVAAITRTFFEGRNVDAVYLVGGTCTFTGFAQLMERQLGIPVFLPKHPLLVTPLGIAMACRDACIDKDERKG